MNGVSKYMQCMRNKYFKQLRVHWCGTQWTTLGNSGEVSNHFHSCLCTATFSKQHFSPLLALLPCQQDAFYSPALWYYHDGPLKWPNCICKKVLYSKLYFRNISNSKLYHTKGRSSLKIGISTKQWIIKWGETWIFLGLTASSSSTSIFFFFLRDNM